MVHTNSGLVSKWTFKVRILHTKWYSNKDILLLPAQNPRSTCRATGAGTVASRGYRGLWLAPGSVYTQAADCKAESAGTGIRSARSSCRGAGVVHFSVNGTVFAVEESISPSFLAKLIKATGNGSC